MILSGWDQTQLLCLLRTCIQDMQFAVRCKHTVDQSEVSLVTVRQSDNAIFVCHLLLCIVVLLPENLNLQQKYSLKQPGLMPKDCPEAEQHSTVYDTILAGSQSGKSL